MRLNILEAHNNAEARIIVDHRRLVWRAKHGKNA